MELNSFHDGATVADDGLSVNTTATPPTLDAPPKLVVTMLTPPHSSVNSNYPLTSTVSRRSRHHRVTLPMSASGTLS